jgi:hypothetical protein
MSAMFRDYSTSAVRYVCTLLCVCARVRALVHACVRAGLDVAMLLSSNSRATVSSHIYFAFLLNILSLFSPLRLLTCA